MEITHSADIAYQTASRTYIYRHLITYRLSLRRCYQMINEGVLKELPLPFMK